jgi:bifunctional non-homologous end joining protein LigD
MNRPSKALARSAPQRSRQRPLPSWIPPMLATLSEVFPTEGKWVYEPKLDGVRALIYASEGAVRVYSRNRKPLNDAYPELVEALGPAVRGDAVLDGEIVAFDPKSGVTSFSRLQQRMQLRDPVRARRSQVEVHLYLFDCLYHDGVDLTKLPLLERKAVLRDVVWYDDPIRFTPFKTSGGVAMLKAACEQGAEGIMAKRAASPYVSTRSTDWLKLKCVRRQEFVIGGYTAPQGSRERLGALLVGYYDGDSLRYAGKVGTGYDRRALDMLHGRLGPLHRLTSPFAEGPSPAGDIQWVTPKLVSEVGFSEWTSAGLLRHPRYLGLRDDKPARQVRREG